MGLFSYFKEIQQQRKRKQTLATLHAFESHLTRKDISVLEILMVFNATIHYLEENSLLTEPATVEKLRKYRLRSRNVVNFLNWQSSLVVPKWSNQYRDLDKSENELKLITIADWLYSSHSVNSIRNVLLETCVTNTVAIDFYNGLTEHEQRLFQDANFRIGDELQTILGVFVLRYISEGIRNGA